ncbi:MAG: hypothetical protein ABSD78_19580 [Acidimicrobiales bacterium]|jgi:hypothetical protein
MIVRILEDGQYDVPASERAALDELDAKLSEAIEAGNKAGFSVALAALIEKVRSSGSKIDATTLVPSELTVPHETASLEDVANLLSSEETVEA